MLFFFNDTATTEIYTLSLHDALPISTCSNRTSSTDGGQGSAVVGHHDLIGNSQGPNFWNYSHKTPGCSQANLQRVDRKSTRLNSSHANISYAVFCLNKYTIRPVIRTS